MTRLVTNTDAIAELQRTFNCDRLYIGGGNSRLVKFKLPAGVKIISNEDGLLGGIALWRQAKPQAAKPTPAAVRLPATAPPKLPVPAASARPAAASVARPAAVPVAKPATAPIAKPARPVVAKPAPVVAKVAAHSTKGVPSPTASTPPANGSPHPSGAPIKKDASGPSPAS